MAEGAKPEASVPADASAVEALEAPSTVVETSTEPSPTANVQTAPAEDKAATAPTKPPLRFMDLSVDIKSLVVKHVSPFCLFHTSYLVLTLLAHSSNRPKKSMPYLQTTSRNRR
jgi:hypothetical protein